MSRLIDADALKKDLDAWVRVINNPKYYVREEALYIIDAMPTVEPKRGKWTTLQQTCNGYGVMYYYHKECEVNGSEIHKRPFPYCPNCGAKMEAHK